MRILIYGGKGWIGSQLAYGLKLHSLDIVFGKARVDHTEALNDEICMIGPSHIIYTQSIEMSEKLDENIKDNLFSPLSLAILCSRRGIHLTYIGTNKIHTIGNSAVESNKTVKGYTDRLMLFFKDNVLNLRIQMPISSTDNPHDFITKICNSEYICDTSNSMTVLPDFIPIWVDMIEKCKTGMYNCVNPGIISYNEILIMYQDIIDPDFTIKEQDTILLSKCTLDTTKLEKEYPQIESIHKAVERILMQRESLGIIHTCIYETSDI